MAVLSESSVRSCDRTALYLPRHGKFCYEPEAYLRSRTGRRRNSRTAPSKRASDYFRSTTAAGAGYPGVVHVGKLERCVGQPHLDLWCLYGHVMGSRIDANEIGANRLHPNTDGCGFVSPSYRG